MNKDKETEEKKNSVLTPEIVKEALDNLPTNYVVQTQELLAEWKSEGKISKTFHDRYIIKVKQEEAFNKIIKNALVKVGISNLETLRLFGSSVTIRK